jgi:hypothetical protein
LRCTSCVDDVVVVVVVVGDEDECGSEEDDDDASDDAATELSVAALVDVKDRCGAVPGILSSL